MKGNITPPPAPRLFGLYKRSWVSASAGVTSSWGRPVQRRWQLETKTEPEPDSERGGAPSLTRSEAAQCQAGAPAPPPPPPTFDRVLRVQA